MRARSAAERSPRAAQGQASAGSWLLHFSRVILVVRRDLLGCRTKTLQGFAPHLVQIGVDSLHALPADLVDAPRTSGPVGDEPRLLEHSQVLGYGGPADRQLPGELADGLGPAGKRLEDRAPGWITECGECPISVSLHEPLVVTYGASLSSTSGPPCG